MGCGVGVGVFGIPGAAFGLRAAEFFEGAEVALLGGLLAAEEAVEGAVVVAGEDGAEGAFGGDLGVCDDGAEQFGLGAGVAAAVPLGLDQGVDEEGLERAFGAELAAVAGSEGLDFRRVFTGDGERAGVNAAVSFGGMRRGASFFDVVEGSHALTVAREPEAGLGAAGESVEIKGYSGVKVL